LSEVDTPAPKKEYYKEKPTTFVMDNMRLSELTRRGSMTRESLPLSQFVIEKKGPESESRRYKNHYVIPVVSTQVVEKRRGF